MTKGFAVICLLALASLQPIWAYQSKKIYINSGGKQRNMLVYTPDELPNNSPLFIVTHGMGGSSENQSEHDHMYELVDTAKFVLVYPRADGDYWDIGGNTDRTFIINTINEMVTRYHINRRRVYWSGFSMGSMLLFHCMPTMLDKIAAFAPTSGIQFSEEPWNLCKSKVNLMECIAYNDNAFNYKKYNIRGYMENMAKMNEYTKYTKKSGYHTQNGTSWFDGDRELWLNENTGHEVVLYSYNYSGKGSHTPVPENSHEIWNFCKRFQLGDPMIVPKPVLTAKEFGVIVDEARTLYESMADTSYATAQKLLDAVKELLDEYTPLLEAQLDDYTDAAKALRDAIKELSTRKINLDKYFAARARIKALIDQYADNPDCNQTELYTNLLKQYDTYDLRPALMARDAFLVSTAQRLNELADSFTAEVATGIISAPKDHAYVLSVEYFDLAGRQLLQPGNGLYIRRTTYSNGRTDVTKNIRK